MRIRLALGLALTAALAAASTSSAQSSGVQLAWNNCARGGGVLDRTFACDSNFGNHVLVASFLAPSGVSRCTRAQGDVEFEFGSTTFPRWWELRNQVAQINQCRNGALSASADFAAYSGCVDFYQGQAAGGISTYQTAYGGQLNRAHGRFTFSLPIANSGPLSAGTEYYAFRLTITNMKTIPSPASPCVGCPITACITFSSLLLYQVNGTPGGDFLLTDPPAGGTRFVTWQNGATAQCGVVPARNATWGAIKSLYR